VTRPADRALRDALTHFHRLQAYAEKDLDDQLVVDAICLRLSAGIEALARMELAELERLFGDDWSEMWGMRNRIAHGYLLINADIVRQTIQDDIPQIVATITAELDVE
jgi:uncharacterized protein with HEPN domain